MNTTHTLENLRLQTAHLGYKDMLEKKAVKYATEFNEVYISVGRVLNDNEFNTDFKIDSLLSWLPRLQRASKLADKSYKDYITYCNEYDYQPITINYVTPYLFHDE